MSRTYRRKSGDQWWRNKSHFYIRDVITDKIIDDPTAEEVEAYLKKQASIYEGRDKHHNSDYIKGMVKWNGNLLRRTCKKEQFAKLKKLNDFNDADYDNTKELYVKCLRWMYD